MLFLIISNNIITNIIRLLYSKQLTDRRWWR